MASLVGTPTEILAAMSAVPPGHPSRPTLRARAIEAWLPLARSLAGRYSGRTVDMDDLVQIATVGLINAVDRFDPEYGTEFVGYAVPTITGEIKRYFRDRTWSVRVPRRLHDLRLAIAEANRTLTGSLMRSPTVADVAAHLEVTDDEVLEGLEIAGAYQAVLLSAPAGAANRVEVRDTLGSDDEGYAQVEARVVVGPALALLSERDRKILTLRFFGNLTQSEIAEQFGFSQMHVSRVIRQSLVRLRRHLGADMEG